MSLTSYQLPKDYQTDIREKCRRSSSVSWWTRVIKQADERRHPAILAISEDSYPPPLDIVLPLYRRNPQAFQDHALRGLAVHGTADTTARQVAAVARDALSSGDWVCLGAAAFRADELAVDADGGPASDVIAGFVQLLAPNKGLLGSPERGYVAVGYFRSLPPEFIPPHSALHTGTSVERRGDWRLLHLLWSLTPGEWRASGQAMEMLKQAANPFVQQLAGRLMDADEEPTPRDRAITVVNPFGECAQGFAAPPPLAKRARQFFSGAISKATRFWRGKQS